VTDARFNQLLATGLGFGALIAGVVVALACCWQGVLIPCTYFGGALVLRITIF